MSKFSPQLYLSTLEESINSLIEEAECVAKDNKLEFQIKTHNYGIINIDWTSSDWSSSDE